MESFDRAAVGAYAALKRDHSSRQIAVLSESLGSGPAAYLCSLPDPPCRIVLVVPFDNLLSVAKDHSQFLPVSLLLRDKWDNVVSLSKHSGKIDIYGVRFDDVIPIGHAKNLAHSLPACGLCSRGDVVVEPAAVGTGGIASRFEKSLIS
jgi:uncharacterized protein